MNLYALQVILDVTPILSDSMGSVINLTTQTVASNLSSKNRDIHQTATEVLDAFMDNIGQYFDVYIYQYYQLYFLKYLEFFRNLYWYISFK